MTRKELELAQQNAVMIGDLNAMYSAITGLLREFGINDDSLIESESSFKSKIPGVLNKLTVKVMTGQFSGQAIMDLSAVLPIMQKYASKITGAHEPKQLN